ncbi:MAG: HlyD family efflux transporter periplasmic adaptor subunit [Chloroflexi bacterium]|nr:HlyD family efflux transporter periplasmic adaptor subunit [Chloroflexota bacterium]
MKLKQILSILIVIIIAGLVLALPRGRAEATGVKTETAAAQTSPINIQAEGELLPQAFVTLAFQADGNVAEILVEEGSIVQAGDPLVKLEASDIELALDQGAARVNSAEAGLLVAQNQLALAEVAVTNAENGVAIAQANLTLTKAGPLPAEIAAAEANLAAAEAAVVRAAASRDSALDIVSDSDLSGAQANLAVATADLLLLEDQYQQILDACFELPDGSEVCPLYGPVEEQTRAQVEVAQARQTAAQETLNFLNSGPTAGQRAVAGSGVGLAIASRDAAQAQLDLLLVGTTPEQIEKAEVGVAQAELGVELAKAQAAQAEAAVSQARASLEAAQAAQAATQAVLDRMTLLATMDGTVAAVNVNPGELVASGTPVVTLADFSTWNVETTDLSELDVAGIEEGGTVTISFDAIPDETVVGTVQSIAYVPGQAQGDVVYQVTVQLADVTNLPLRWGMTAVTEFAN